MRLIRRSIFVALLLWASMGIGASNNNAQSPAAVLRPDPSDQTRERRCQRLIDGIEFLIAEAEYRHARR